MTLFHGIFHEEKKVGKHGTGWRAAHCGLLRRVALTWAAVRSAGGFLKMRWTEVQLFFVCDVLLLLLLFGESYIQILLHASY